MSYQTSSKRSPPFWLLIGARKLVFFWHQSEARTAATVWNWSGIRSGKTSSPVACSRLRDGGEKSFSNKKCEKRAGAGERHFSRRHRPLSQVVRLIFALLVLIRSHKTIWEPGTGYVPRGSSRRSLLFFVSYFSARLDFPSSPLSAPGTPRMMIDLRSGFFLCFCFFASLAREGKKITPSSRKKITEIKGRAWLQASVS